jgi:DNA polymerase V
LEPGNGKIAVCVINGEFTLKRLSVLGNEIWLTSENKEFKPIKISEFHDFEIWGILTFSIKGHK